MRDIARTTIHTYSGGNINLADVHPKDINPLDIAWSLSRQPRFNGHTTEIMEREWTVAHHVLLVARIIAEHGGTSDQIMAGVLHDAHEAYVGDIATPVKNLIGSAYEGLADNIDQAIELRFDLPSYAFEDPVVKGADASALRLEAFKLLRTQGKPEINEPSYEWPTGSVDANQFEIVWSYDRTAAYQFLLSRLKERLA